MGFDPVRFDTEEGLAYFLTHKAGALFLTQCPGVSEAEDEDEGGEKGEGDDQSSTTGAKTERKTDDKFSFLRDAFQYKSYSNTENKSKASSKKRSKMKNAEGDFLCVDTTVFGSIGVRRGFSSVAVRVKAQLNGFLDPTVNKNGAGNPPTKLRILYAEVDERISDGEGHLFHAKDYKVNPDDIHNPSNAAENNDESHHIITDKMRLTRFTPDHPGFPMAVRQVQSAIFQITTAQHHALNTHLFTTAAVTYANMLNLDGAHPLRRLLYMCEVGNHRIAEELANQLMNDQGLAKHIMSWTRQGFQDLLKLGSQVFDFEQYQTLRGILGRILPEGGMKEMLNKSTQGEKGTSNPDDTALQIVQQIPLGWAPVLDQLRDWWMEMSSFVTKYIDVTYGGGQHQSSQYYMQQDPQLRRWYAHLRQMILSSKENSDSFSRANIIELATGYMWTSSVYHEAVGAAIAQASRNPFQISGFIYLDITGRRFHNYNSGKSQTSNHEDANRSKQDLAGCLDVHSRGEKNNNGLSIITPSLIQSSAQYRACMPFMINSRGETVTHNIVAATALADEGPKLAKDWSHMAKGVDNPLSMAGKRRRGRHFSRRRRSRSRLRRRLLARRRNAGQQSSVLQQTTQDLEPALKDLWLEHYWRLTSPSTELTWNAYSDDELWNLYQQGQAEDSDDEKAGHQIAQLLKSDLGILYGVGGELVDIVKGAWTNLKEGKRGELRKKQRILEKLREWPRGVTQTKLEKKQSVEVRIRREEGGETHSQGSQMEHDKAFLRDDPWDWATEASAINHKYGEDVQRGYFRDRLEEKSRKAQEVYGRENGLFADLFPETLESSVAV